MYPDQGASFPAHGDCEQWLRQFPCLDVQAQPTCQCDWYSHSRSDDWHCSLVLAYLHSRQGLSGHDNMPSAFLIRRV
ncbi:MAG: hypothetical protein MUQ10_09990, partial [Anaerolineae bacterium]|nr:hypothetical protein [Anaerolineae bacterium]